MENQSCQKYKITSIKKINDTVFQITVNSINPFYLRADYLENSNIILDVDIELAENDYEDCINAGLAYGAEKKAMEYLGKSEHSRFMLKAKLIKKGFYASFVDKSLDYLESKKYLDDSRFAMAFLRNRAITHFEGRNRLLQELLQRGVDKKIAQNEIEEFFVEKNEVEICQRALEKLRRIGKKEEKIFVSLERLGFPNRVIREIL